MREKLQSLAAELVAVLKQKNLTISCAESCTGGMLAEIITSVSGASAVFELGVVSYSSRIKNKVLGVENDTLNTLGAVSAETALQMAENVRLLSNADIALSVTGVAGPEPSENKAVGTVYVALSADNYIYHQKLNISPKGRDFVRESACEQLLLMAYNFIKNNNESV
ncbi:MAG: CinA family protein [Ruminococcaceae bacterium]|nr:CinA family protein [Oscillospiraceae bacterium]